MTAAFTSPVLTGSRVSHYAVGERLGAGGMGEVYRARDTRLERDVALKFLHHAADAGPDRARLLREARAASALRSPAIAALFDIGEHDAIPFIVMELVEGEPLSARIARGPLAVDDAVAIASQVADALDEAHGHGIIHRDIKSANVMVDARRRVKLVDFGLAKMFEARDRGALALTSEQTAAGTVMGTFAYMSPEQIRGRSSLDARTDLFSLGIVLYEMLAGRLPFDGATITDVTDRILNAEPEALARFNYGLPESLEAIVRKALTKDPALRYQSARELHVDLQRVAREIERRETQGLRRSTRGDTALEHQSGGGRRISGPSAAVPAIAVMTFSNITRESADDWIGMGIAETVTADLKKVRGLGVIGRTQVFDAIKHLSGPSLERVEESLAIDIGRRLGATWVVGGGYQRLGPMIRITAACADVRTGELVRSVKVDGRVEDIFALQDRIVCELSAGLDLTLRPAELEAIGRDETGSLEAWEAFSRGMLHLRLATRESLERAVSLFEQALGHDPEYASAWALLGVTYMLQGTFLAERPLLHKAVEACARALAIDPDNGYALSALGSAYVNLDRTDEAIAVLTRAVDLEPTNVLARGTLARALWVGKGRFDEGIDVLRRALGHNADAGYLRQQLALLLAIRGDLPSAAVEAERAVALQESLKSGTDGVQLVGSYLRLGYVRYRQGDYAAAIALYDRERAFLARHDHALAERLGIEIPQKLSAAWWRSDNRAKADEAFAEVVSKFEGRRARGTDDPFTTYYVASLHALRGEEAAAMRLLGEAVSALPALNRARARLDPDFDPIRRSAAFAALVDESER
jgi:serine/threonine protein kinase/tetratricopeptide (TPR) repeat protein